MAAIAFFPFEFVDIPGVKCAFTSRRGGVSEPPHDSSNISFEVGDNAAAVKMNRRLIYDRLALTGWCECKQIHGDIMHFDPAPHPPETMAEIQGDAMATATPGIGLIIKTADCQPVLIAHRSGKFVAGFHIGWRGNKIKFLISGVRCFCEKYDLNPHDLYAVRGPSLSPTAAEFVNFDSDFGPGFKKYFDETTKTVDLWSLTRDQLMEAGLPEKHIFGIDLCTMGQDDTFYSYRRACASPVKETGRQCGIIWIRPE